ncbi:MAG: DNA topoisomerase [Myxococcota bacterium]
MSRSLVITEKPSVARDIVAALGGFREADGFWESEDYLVTFSVGHIVELLSPEEVDPKYKRWTLDTLPILPEKFELKPKAGASERIRTIKKLLARDDVQDVINACDAGREGELIFREIVNFLGNRKPTRRLWLRSMTQAAIRHGFDSLAPGEDYDGLGAAAACRSQSDWLIGLNATRALTRRLKGRKEKTAWSAGRVQTPTLAIMVGRELEILSHVALPYWQLEARFSAGGHQYVGLWFDPAFVADESRPELRDDRLFDETRANAIIDAITGQAGAASETRKPSRETAPPLFDLTSLQREGNRRFGWSARRTLNAAQRCYEMHKVLTYPRTDSRVLPEDYRDIVDEILRTLATAGRYQSEARALIERGLENTRRTFDDSKVSDHFALIPTGRLPEAPLTGDDGRLFDLVTRRFLSTFFPPAVWTRVERTTEVAGNSFRSRSRTLDEPGWRTVMGQTEQKDQALPPLVAGRTESQNVAADTLDLELNAERTKPAPRISEARLLSLMESAGRQVEDEELAEAMREKGIGTPATRADIIENLIAKGYVVRSDKALRPTVKGIRLVDVLNRIHADRLARPDLTGELEFRLSQVERGTRTPEEFMQEIVGYTREVVDITVNFDYEDLYRTDPTLGACPLCQRDVFERSWFYRCEEAPGVSAEEDCPFRIWKDKSGRYIDRNTVETLLDKGETGELEGFTYRDGRTYNAHLSLEDGELQLHAVQGSAAERVSDVPDYDVDDRPLGPCAMGCGSDVIETPTEFRCQAGLARAADNERKARAWAEERKAAGQPLRKYKVPREDQPCPFVLPRTVCKREMRRDDCIKYIRDRETEMLDDFTSRFGRPFGAKLVLKDNGRHGFEFMNASTRGQRKTAAATRGAGKKTTRKNASPSRKTATKAKRPAKAKSAARSGAAKKTTRKKTVRKKAARTKAARKKTPAEGKAARKRAAGRSASRS